MILKKVLTSQEILETLLYLAGQTLPPRQHGTLHATWLPDGRVEIIYTDDRKNN